MSTRNRIIPVFVPHLGCPHDCVFCNQRRISGSAQPATADEVRKIIGDALNRFDGTFEVAFYGGSFTAIERGLQTELLTAAEEFVPTGRISGFRVSTRPDAVDEETISFLKTHNVSTVELGVQSMDERVLLLSGRGHTARDAVNASRLLKAGGIRLVLQMMTGLPGSNDDSDIETARALIRFSPDGVRIYPTVIIRDTALYDLWKEGRYIEHTPQAAVNVCSRIMPLFREAGIPVIRLGLNPTDDLSSGDAVGGAYHPALGELVMAREMRNIAAAAIEKENLEEGESILLRVAPGFISKMTGQHRENIFWLKEKFSLKSVKVVSGNVPEYGILIEKQ